MMTKKTKLSYKGVPKKYPSGNPISAKIRKRLAIEMQKIEQKTMKQKTPPKHKWYYYCKKCRKQHSTFSHIGRSHWGYRRM